MIQRIRVLLRSEKIRFGLVGAVNTGVDLCLYVLLHLAGVPAIAANLVSTSAGLSVSFVTNRTFTFSQRPSGAVHRQLLLFVSCTGVGLWLLQPVIILGADWVLAPVSELGDARVVFGKLLAIAVGMIWNWTIYNTVVFRSGARMVSSVSDPGTATVVS